MCALRSAQTFLRCQLPACLPLECSGPRSEVGMDVDATASLVGCSAGPTRNSFRFVNCRRIFWDRGDRREGGREGCHPSLSGSVRLSVRPSDGVQAGRCCPKLYYERRSSCTVAAPPFFASSVAAGDKKRRESLRSIYVAVRSFVRSLRVAAACQRRTNKRSSIALHVLPSNPQTGRGEEEKSRGKVTHCSGNARNLSR